MAQWPETDNGYFSGPLAPNGEKTQANEERYISQECREGIGKDKVTGSGTRWPRIRGWMLDKRVLTHRQRKRTHKSEEQRIAQQQQQQQNHANRVHSHKKRQVEGRQEILLATYNIRSGNSSKLPMAIRAIEQSNVYVCIFTETRLTGFHTKSYRGYQVVATNSGTTRTGGVAIVFRTGKHWTIEDYITHGPNVISSVLRSGKKSWIIIGAYFPPSGDVQQLSTMIDLATQRRNGSTIICGDFNLRLGSVSTARDITLTTSLMASG